MASLLAELTQSGSVKSDGEPNATGTVYAYLPNTVSPATLYTDSDLTAIATQPITLDNGGRIPRTDYPDGLWVTQPVRLLVQDSSGATVSDGTYIPADAGNTAIENEGFTSSTLDGAMTAALESFGGRDFKYKESGGADERLLQDKFREIWISVKDFGAVGDGIAIDTSAIQEAMDRVKAIGGGVCYFPPGTYKIDGALTLTSATGVILRGSNKGSTAIESTSTAANMFTLTSCASCGIEDLDLFYDATSSGASIALTTANGINVTRVNVASGTIGCDVTGQNVIITDCLLRGSGAGGIGLRSECVAMSVRGGTFLAGSTAIQFKAGAARTVVDGVDFGTSATPIGIEFASGLTGTKFIIANCPALGGLPTPISIGISTLPVYRQWGNGIDASATSGATGAAQTPVLYTGNEVNLTAASGGAGVVTVNAPAILPGTSTSDVNLFWDFIFKNAATGAVTWTLNAVYVVAAAIPTTDAHTIAVRFRWDRTTSKLREVSRADTVT